MERNFDIWFVSGPRENILDILQKNPQRYSRANSQSFTRTVSEEKLSFIWFEEPTPDKFFPNLILGRKLELDDLFSWSATYLKDLGPLSAQCRISTYDWFDKVINYNDYSPYSITGNGLIGLIMAEVSYLAKRIIPAEEISVAACHSTLSYTLIKYLKSYSNVEHLVDISEYWLRAKHLTDQKNAQINVSPIVKCFLSLIRPDEIKVKTDVLSENIVLDILEHIKHDKRLYPDQFSFYPHHMLRSYNKDFYDLSSEERLKVYDIVSDHIAFKSDLANDTKAFFIALFASLCRPGVFETISLLAPYVNKYPEALLWYGVIQCNFTKNDSYRCGNGLGWRLYRDINLQEYVLDIPKCDISFMELEVYSRLKAGLKLIKSETKGKLMVELLPGVNATFKTADNAISPKVDTQLSLTGISSNISLITPEVLHKIQYSLENTMNIVNEALEFNSDSKTKIIKKKPYSKKQYWKKAD